MSLLRSGVNEQHRVTKSHFMLLYCYRIVIEVHSEKPRQEWIQSCKYCKGDDSVMLWKPPLNYALTSLLAHVFTTHTKQFVPCLFVHVSLDLSQHCTPYNCHLLYVKQYV